MFVRVAYLRHGETIANKLGQFQGTSDHATINGLTQEGELQIRRAASEMYRVGFIPKIIIASPLSRAVHSAGIVSVHIGHTCITEDKRLMERSFGKLEGVSIKEVMARHGINSLKELLTGGVDFSSYGGDSDEMVRHRINGLEEYLIDSFAGNKVLLVGHGAYLQVWLVKNFGSSEFVVKNGGFIEFDLSKNGMENVKAPSP